MKRDTEARDGWAGESVNRTNPTASWWIGLMGPAFYAWLHEHEEDRIRRKPSFGREEKAHDRA